MVSAPTPALVVPFPIGTPGLDREIEMGPGRPVERQIEWIARRPWRMLTWLLMWLLVIASVSVTSVSLAGSSALAFTPAITEFPIPTPSSVSVSIAAGRDGALWFGEAAGNKIGRIATSGAITEFPLPATTPGDGPVGIAAGPDGALWFT